MNQKEAKQLWLKLQQHLINAGRVIAEIIEKKAWEPLGYSTFAEAWTAEMSEITLAAEIRPHVVYQMLAEGLSHLDIANVVRGVGPGGAEALDRQRKNGVPADYAVVREHFRRPPAPADTLHIKVGKTMFAEYHRIANKLGISVEEVAKQAIADRFRELASSRKKRVAS